MTAEELAGVREFLATLPQKRQQLADTALLDQCQEWLGKLIGHIDDAEPRRFANEKEAAQTLEPHYPEPAHIEEVPPDEPFVHHREGQAVAEEPPHKPKVTRRHPHKR